MIYQGSRYENSTVVTIPTSKGWIPTVYRDLGPVLTTGEVQLAADDTLQHLAFRLYGDAELWWVLADANPDIGFPDRVPAGTLLKVP